MTAHDQRCRVRRCRPPCRRINGVKGSLALISRYLLLSGISPKLAVPDDVVFFKPIERTSFRLPLSATQAQIAPGALKHIDRGQRQRSGTAHAASKPHRIFREGVVVGERSDPSQLVI